MLINKILIFIFSLGIGLNANCIIVSENKTLDDKSQDCLMQIGGTIWNDEDKNGILENQPGNIYFEGITMSLYDVTNEVIVSEVITNSEGVYLFDNIEPGQYKVIVDSSNFVTGSFVYYVSSQGQGLTDLNIDNDDDGDDGDGELENGSESRIFLMSCGEEPEEMGNTNNTIDFGFYNPFVCSSSSLAMPSCELIEWTTSLGNGGDLLCDLNVLDNYCATNIPAPLTGNAPIPLCPNGGEATNMSWYTFIAGTGDYEINIKIGYCKPGPYGNNLGIQAGIYTDCTFNDPIVCVNECSIDSISLPSTDLIPGEHYFIFINGCDGSICDFEIDINGMFAPYFLPDPTGIICTDNLCDGSICPGQELGIMVEGVDLATNYYWEIPAGVDVLNPNPNDPSLTLENTIDLFFPNPGSYTICMTEASNYCSSTSEICKDIVVSASIDEIFDDEYVCEKLNQQDNIPNYNPVTTDDPNGDGTIGWQGPNFPVMASGLNTAIITSPEGCTYTQSITLIPIPEIPVVDFDTAACEPFIIPTPLGAAFDVDTNIENVVITYPGASEQGCDTTINYTAYILNIVGEIQDLVCAEDGFVSLTFDEFVVSPPVAMLDSISYVWTNEMGIVLTDNNSDGQMNSIEINEGGLVYLTITMEVFGVECSYIFSKEVDIDMFYPDINITITELDNNLIAYSVDNIADEYTWSITSGTIVYGITTDSIIVDWEGVEGGEVCVIIDQLCSSLVCIDGITSVEENSKIQNDFTVYPNPTEGYINIDFSSKPHDLTIKLYDMTGKLCPVDNFSLQDNIFSIDLSNLNTSLYILEIIYDDKIACHKIIVE